MKAITILYISKLVLELKYLPMTTHYHKDNVLPYIRLKCRDSILEFFF